MLFWSPGRPTANRLRQIDRKLARPHLPSCTRLGERTMTALFSLRSRGGPPGSALRTHGPGVWLYEANNRRIEAISRRSERVPAGGMGDRFSGPGARVATKTALDRNRVSPAFVHMAHDLHVLP
jgi:hypothetical protein